MKIENYSKIFRIMGHVDDFLSLLCSITSKTPDSELGLLFSRTIEELSAVKDAECDKNKLKVFVVEVKKVYKELERDGRVIVRRSNLGTKCLIVYSVDNEELSKGELRGRCSTANGVFSVIGTRLLQDPVFVIPIDDAQIQKRDFSKALKAAGN